MPLRILKTRSIKLNVSTLRTFSSRTSNLLIEPEELVAQKEENWCWAACILMAANYYKTNPMSQCELATTWANIDQDQSRRIIVNCCDSATANFSSMCDKGLPPSKMAAYFQKVNIRSKWIEGSIEATDLKDEIDNKRPVLIGLKVKTSSGVTRFHHVHIVDGYVLHGNELSFSVKDPWPVNAGSIRPLKYSELKERKFGGREWEWAHTWTGLEG